MWLQTSSTAGSGPRSHIDRDTASRMGILPQAIDNTLYDAFGQRQVSIIFTQLNQYHVVLEVLPTFAKTLDAMNDVYVRPSSATPSTGRTYRQCGHVDN